MPARTLDPVTRLAVVAEQLRAARRLTLARLGVGHRGRCLGGGFIIATPAATRDTNSECEGDHGWHDNSHR